MDFFNPDETLCDCGHPRKLHSISFTRRVPCMFRHPTTDAPCRCNCFTITLKHLPGRLTEEDIVERATAGYSPTVRPTGQPTALG